jgi:hypothetical protein
MNLDDETVHKDNFHCPAETVKPKSSERFITPVAEYTLATTEYK